MSPRDGGAHPRCSPEIGRQSVSVEVNANQDSAPERKLKNVALSFGKKMGLSITKCPFKWNAHFEKVDKYKIPTMDPAEVTEQEENEGGKEKGEKKRKATRKYLKTDSDRLQTKDEKEMIPCGQAIAPILMKLAQRFTFAGKPLRGMIPDAAHYQIGPDT
ncbi:hypothetical protein HNY73_004692 [Argiope bruennichi]|uniref:Uncharacterized protein n=1 Tax=Argiope bruennichi TaxID=94029 RepID=A0A8T0FQS3_ARGBR|nr:hypothetical protein HNY73_004692 [Argiope bruennichi]